MQRFVPKPNRWPLLAVIMLAVVFIGDTAVRGQRGGPPPRPQPQFQPGRPPGNPQPGIPRPQNQGRPGFVPPVNQPKQMEWVTVYSCSRCGAQLGQGPAPPALASCPHCGARFGGAGGNPMRVAQQQQPAAPNAWPGGLSQAFYVTLGVEGLLLAGMILLGIIRLAVSRSTRPVPGEG
jgi:DNA-directed RNA polymerase subunit RPC12/RpoP